MTEDGTMDDAKYCLDASAMLFGIVSVLPSCKIAKRIDDLLLGLIVRINHKVSWGGVDISVS